MMQQAAIAIMAKKPAIGHTKTRLCPPLTDRQAAALYQALLQDTIDLVAGIDRAVTAIAFTPPDAISYFEGISPPGTILYPVTCSDIGDCLDKTLAHLLALGYPKALALNGDGPSLPPQYLEQAIDALEHNDTVFGPTQDGGYYLVGVRQAHPALFSGITWSTDQVLVQSMAIARNLNLSTTLLPAWYDVDTARELELLRAELASLPKTQLLHSRRIEMVDQEREVGRVLIRAVQIVGETANRHVGQRQ